VLIGWIVSLLTGGSMEELLKDKSTQLWVLQLVHSLQDVDIVDAINGLVAVSEALKKDLEKMVGEVPS
tara:strand:- start:294 stop:497 length:204 start_codon:yes stop_codon:yes gene_type:complete